MALHVYSTLTRKKEAFPKSPGEPVTMYVCGPTVYKPSHIGHMVGPVIFDTVKRYLTYLGYPVTWVVNITDVDDKLIARAKELGTTVPELAGRMTADYFDCLKRLNVTGVDHFPKATDHIPDMIALIGRLVETGYAYPAGGDVYFDVSRDADYGKLCGFDPEQLEAGARVEAGERKRNPGDFALWKGAKPGEPREVTWDSPWGPGRPGWHIECSAMSRALLGDTIDVHGGGLDLRFPHHENELAQSESATDKPFARVWMHNGLLKMKSGKMAGSVGNVLNVADALTHVSGEVLRFFILGTHYRSPIDLGDWDPKSGAVPSGLAAAKKGYDAFARFAERYERIVGENFYALPAPAPAASGRLFTRPEYAEFAARFRAHMDDDFNTGGAVGVLFELATALNRLADAGRLENLNVTQDETAHAAFEEGAALLNELGQVLGLFFEPPPVATLGGTGNLVSGLMQLLIDLRANLRAAAKAIPDKADPTKRALFDQTDLIRQRLADLGVTLEDRAGGTTWRMGS